MFSEGISLATIRRQIEALERKCARQLAMYWARPVADQITELWNIAVAKNQPVPDPLSCVRKFAEAGFRLQTFTALHTYIKDCRTYGNFPDPREILEKIFPPGKKVSLAAVPLANS